MSADPRAALNAEVNAIAGVLSGRTEADFAVVSKCPPWTLKELTVHIWGTIQMPAAWTPSDASPTTAPDYYRRTERESDAYRQLNVERSRRAAARYASGLDAARALRAAAEGLTTRLERDDLAQVVEIGAVGAMRLDEYLATRVASVAIHGLDVAITLSVPPFTTELAEGITVELLESLAGSKAAALGWPNAEFISRASGRTRLSEVESDRLGALTELFPVIS